MSDDRDQIVSGFAQHLHGTTITKEEYETYRVAVQALPLPLPIKKAIRKELREHIEAQPVTISGQHAHSLSELVKYFKKMIETGNVPVQEGRGDVLTVGYCDELLLDLGAGQEVEEVHD